MRHLFLLFILIFFHTSAHAQEDVNKNLGLKGWSAFKCTAYAKRYGKTEEAVRLFNLGYDSLKELLELIQSGTITEETVRKTVPAGITQILREGGGRSVDFYIGRIYSETEQLAYESIVKQDNSGLYLAPDKWKTDPDLKKHIAGNKFLSANCELIR